MSAIPSLQDRARSLARSAAVWLFIAILAWSPFPLGGAIAWAAGLQEILIAICWLLWVLATGGAGNRTRSSNHLIFIPAAFAALAVFWAIVQVLPGMPTSWTHPIWAMASDTLGTSVPSVISLNPWRTEAEILKLASYAMACWLAFRMARRSETAVLLWNAVITIGGAYALYAFILEFAGSRQTEIFYSVPYHNTLLSGPFMLHNSFATYSGLVAIAAIAKLFAKGSAAIQVGRGWRRLIHSTLLYCFGGGAFVLVATVLAFAGVVASASRAGFAATMCGLIAIALVSVFVVRGKTSRRWAFVGALAAAVPLLFLITFSGGSLGARIGELLANDAGDQVRFSLWAATSRMINDAPFFGLGLGTFEDAYPLYALQVYPFVMDKAHCDYLEFAAGLGLPAAIAWWGALLWLVALSLRGVRQRHRNRHYAIAAVGASVLIAVHSSVDFSLQMPAVALLYATLIGVGVSQSQSSRRQLQA